MRGDSLIRKRAYREVMEEFDLSQQDDVRFMPGLARLSPEGTQTCVARLGGTRGLRGRHCYFTPSISITFR